MAWCTTTWAHSRPFTAWTEASVTPPASAGAFSCSDSQPGKQPRIAFQFGQLGQGVEIIAVGRTGPLAPLVERRGTGVEAAITDLGPEHGQHVGRRSRPGRPTDPAHVVGQVPYFARFPLAAFVLEPPGQAGQVLDRRLPAHQIEQ